MVFDQKEYNTLYYKNNKQRIKEQKKEYKENNRDKFKSQKKKWNTTYYKNNKDKIRKSQKEYYENNKEKVSTLNIIYRENNMDKVKNQRKEYRERNRDKLNKRKRESHINDKVKALKIIDKNLKCSNCGCEDILILEINHIYGDGNKEQDRNHLHRNIIKGVRNTEDLEIRCKLCNILYYIEMKYNIKRFKVSWN